MDWVSDHNLKGHKRLIENEYLGKKFNYSKTKMSKLKDSVKKNIFHCIYHYTTIYKPVRFDNNDLTLIKSKKLGSR